MFYYINQLEMSLTKSPLYFAQYYYITQFFTISTILSLAAPAMPLFHGDSGTHSVLTIKTHQQGPFTMAIISSQSSRTTSPPSYGITNGA
jgi:hypothetical protein